LDASSHVINSTISDWIVQDVRSLVFDLNDLIGCLLSCDYLKTSYWMLNVMWWKRPIPLYFFGLHSY